METKEKIVKFYNEKLFCKIYRQVEGKTEKRSNGIVVNYSDDFVLIQEIYDFKIDGFSIFPIKTISKIVYGNNEKYYNKILHFENIPSKVNYNLKVNLKNWETIFKSLKKLNFNVTIENENYLDETFDIGPIIKITKNAVFIRYFNAKGILNDENTKINWTQVTITKFDTRYVNIFSKYLRERKTKK